MTDLSIVIVTYNTVDLLGECLRSIQAFVDLTHAEVIVVDNASSDGSQQVVATEHPYVRLICNPGNRGFAQANNQGLRAANGRYLFLLNSDAALLNPAAAVMMGYLDEHANTAILGASLRNANGSRQYACDLFPLTPWRMLAELVIDRIRLNNRWTRRGRLSRWTYTEPFEVDWVLGAALMIRRSAMEQVGLLDERFFMYAEDIDWCFRAKRAGWKVVFMPSALVLHHGQGSSPGTQMAQARATRRADESLFMLYRKHYGLAAEAGLRLITFRRRMADRLSGARG
jgi:GT2 family glycosyltransferase